MMSLTHFSLLTSHASSAEYSRTGKIAHPPSYTYESLSHNLNNLYFFARVRRMKN